MSESFRKEAEAHWEYTDGLMVKIIKLYGQPLTDEMRDLIRYCYVEAMIHGYKHALEIKNKEGNEQ